MAKFNLGNGNDRFTGTQYDDEIYGNGGADYIDASGGNDFVNGGAGDDGIAGGDGNDWLLGGEGTDTLNGEGGDDMLRDQAGNDTYFGGEGNDTLEGGHGDDHVYGEGGHDRFVLVGDGHVWMNGGTGNDTYRLAKPESDWERPTINENTGEGLDLVELDGGWGELIDSFTLPINVEDLTLLSAFAEKIEHLPNQFDELDVKHVYGNTLANVLTGSLGSDLLHGGQGNDTLVGNGSGYMADWLWGDEGNDTMIDDGGYAKMIGGTGDDTYVVTMDGTYAADLITEYAGGGYDTLKFSGGTTVTMAPQIERLVLTGPDSVIVHGNAQANLVNGNIGADVIHGEGGDDLLYGNIGDDSLIGGAGNDLLAGEIGNDSLSGGSGNDVLDGGDGDDELWADDGADRLNGGAGNDRLCGGAGADQLTGGAGADKFYFTAASQSTTLYGVDRITDFTRGADRIDLSTFDADAASPGTQMLHLVPAFTGHAGEVLTKVLGDTTMVYADLNGDRTADMQIGLTGVFTLTAADFDGVWG